MSFKACSKNQPIEIADLLQILARQLGPATHANGRFVFRAAAPFCPGAGVWAGYHPSDLDH